MTGRRRSSSRSGPPFAFADPKHSLAAGILLTTLGSWLLYEAYERRGVSRPWALRLLPGA